MTAWKSLFRLSFCVALAVYAAVAAPTYILITVPSGAPGGAGLPALLAEWRQTGMVADLWLLNSSQREKATFDSLAVLQFSDDAAVSAWQRNCASHMGAGAITTKVDTLARGETFPRDSTKAIFLAAQYDIMASHAKYREFVKGYVTPEMEALRTRNILTSYFLFAARDHASAPWHSLLIMEYRDSVALDHRSQAMDEVRSQLASNATWKALSDAKPSIRTERSLTQASWELLPAPALSDLPSYKPEYRVTGTIRILGSFLKFATAALEEGFLKYQPDAQFAANFSTSSEGAIGGLCTGISDIAPAGDDAKIPT
jgi:hypothetical protein